LQKRLHVRQPPFSPPVVQGALCGSFQVRGYPTMKLGTAADLGALALDKLVEVQPASRRADAVVAWLAKHLDV
jgi:hypothetical protein